MKKFLILCLVALCGVFVNPAAAQEMCPGHGGDTVASLRECVLHAAAEGHITAITNSLLDKIDAAQAAVDQGQPALAVEALRAFIHEVQAQAGKHIDAEHAGHMIDHAQRVIGALGG